MARLRRDCTLVNVVRDMVPDEDDGQMAGNAHHPVTFNRRGEYIQVYDPRHGKMRPLHRVVYELKVGPIPEGWFVHHRDGDKRNNDPGNLEAVDPRRHPMGHAHYRRECELAQDGLMPRPSLIEMPPR